ncbi:hypothetical protein GCM10023351_07720 [Microbacterium gilvum]|uniref:Uncharacterized protein n=1 Tax=Microbacterium gilvum TaxID=1336204 RepID=A0ABP8ZUX5_9MICO
MLAKPETLSQEQQVEQASFRDSSNVLESLDGDLIPRCGMGPDRGVVDALNEGGEMHARS